MYPLYRFFWLTICVAIRFTNGGWLDTEVKDWPATGRRICMDAAWNKPEEIVGMETGCLDYGKSFTGPWIGPAVGERELAVDFESGTDTNAYWMLRGDIRPPKDGPPQLDLGQVYQDYLVSIYALPNVMDSKRYWFPGCLTAWQNPDAYKEGDRWDGNSKQALGVVYLENCNPGNPQQDFVWRISNELDSLKGPNDTRIDLRRLFPSFQGAETFCDDYLNMWNIPNDQYDDFATANNVPEDASRAFRGMVWGCSKWPRWTTLERPEIDNWTGPPVATSTA